MSSISVGRSIALGETVAQIELRRPVQQVLVASSRPDRTQAVDVPQSRDQELMPRAHEVGRLRSQTPRVVPVHGVESSEHSQKPRNALGGPAVDEVEVGGHHGSAPQHSSHEPHDDELDVARGELAQDLSVPPAVHLRERISATESTRFSLTRRRSSGVRSSIARI
jgi:hypothetical protein